MLLISLFVTIYIIFHTNWVGPKPLLQQPRGNCRTVDFKTNQCTSNKTVEHPQPKPNPKEKNIYLGRKQKRILAADNWQNDFYPSWFTTAISIGHMVILLFVY